MRWAHKHYREGARFWPPAIGAFVAASVCVWWAWPVPAIADHPTLSDRYAESWDVGPNGTSIDLDKSSVLPSKVGKLQMFTPAVRAPKASSLSNVWLGVCLPLEFKVDPVNPAPFAKVWTLQEISGCARYTTWIARIPRGGGINPLEAIHFRPTRSGDFMIIYSIASNEADPYFGSFVVRVMP